jgi:hypothetical protein
MGEMVVPLGVIVATFGTLIGLLIVFRKWLAIRERMIAEMFPDTSAPVQTLRQPEPKRSGPPQSGAPAQIAA